MNSSSSILRFASQYSLYANCITSGIGLIGNVLNILIFTRLRVFRNNRCAFYLTIESISNFINEVFTLILTIVTSIYGDNSIGFSLIWCRLRYIIYQTTSLVTYSMICLSACDQFCSTNYRFNVRQMFTLKLARYFVFIFVYIWFLHSILYALYVNIQPLLGCMMLNRTWIRYSTFFYYPVLIGFLPIIISTTFSLLAFDNVRRVVRRQIRIERRRFDHQITAMVLIRVVFFTIFALPYASYRVYAINIKVNQIDLLRSAIEQLIQAVFYSFINLNCAVKFLFSYFYRITFKYFRLVFYLFSASSSRYRRQVKYVLMKKCWRQLKKWCCLIENRIRPKNSVFSYQNIELE